MKVHENLANNNNPETDNNITNPSIKKYFQVTHIKTIAHKIKCRLQSYNDPSSIQSCKKVIFLNICITLLTNIFFFYYML